MVARAHRDSGARPSVSVVIPAFQAERTLASTLASVLAQSFRDFEVIVVDDGSTDRTNDIAQQFAARDPRVRVLFQPNAGVAHARNAGIRAARGPYVAPIDADDLWHPTFLEKLHAALGSADEETVFAFAGFRNIDLHGRVSGSGELCPVTGNLFHQFMLRNFVGNGSGMMFRREAALEAGGYEPRLQHEFDAQGCEDWLLQLRLALRGKAVAVCEYLVGYRSVPGAMSSDHRRMWRSRIHAFELLFEEVDVAASLTGRWALGSARAHCMVRELLAGRVREAAGSLRVALSLDPVGTAYLVFEGLERTTRWGIGRIQRLLGLRTRRPFSNHAPLSRARELRGGLMARRLKQAAILDLATNEFADRGETRLDLVGGPGKFELPLRESEEPTSPQQV